MTALADIHLCEAVNLVPLGIVREHACMASLAVVLVILNQLVNALKMRIAVSLLAEENWQIVTLLACNLCR